MLMRQKCKQNVNAYWDYHFPATRDSLYISYIALKAHLSSTTRATSNGNKIVNMSNETLTMVGHDEWTDKICG